MMRLLRKWCCDDDDDDEEEHLQEENYQQRLCLRREQQQEQEQQQQHHYQLQYGVPASSSFSSSLNNRMNRSLVDNNNSNNNNSNNWSLTDATVPTTATTTSPTTTTTTTTTMASLRGGMGASRRDTFSHPASAWFGRVWAADHRAAGTTGSTNDSTTTSNLSLYQIAPQRSDSPDEEEDNDDNNDDDDDDDLSDHRNCCRPGERRHADPLHRGPHNNHLLVEPNALNTTRGEGNDTSSPGTIPEFFRNLAERWRVYDSLEHDHHTTPEDRHASMAAQADGQHRHPPLRQASRFDSSSDILTIRPDEIVLPGSDLQQQMAVAALSKYHLTRTEKTTAEEEDDECVICMEGFDPTNPRMPTLCGCGENKTYFHLPCLYQWMEQSRECPSCRQSLRWEEF